ncbi:hypothetical protein PV10_06135 [Exophiala mesophila]|uniref:CENP-V/GFA domain-containing protein n=1 Tax=Exophiala mesophila TaxID=212818 RepID=A0A0D1ZAB4_EXOME|nr:uncharacterized protein PV10_06135 [Exophiala mesophila]KIV91617.1 hypothetical protein PV10_06135 [Exophiala mesophila]
MTACHCKTCQKISGGPFLGFAGLKASDLKWSQQPDMWSISDIAERGFCKVCGSAMSMKYAFGGGKIGVTLGTITAADPPLPPIKDHIFLAEKASWFVLPDDGAAREDDFGGDWRERIARWREQHKQEDRSS